MAFMHGAQDGQKFMGVFMLGIFLAKGQETVTSFQIPLWLMILCSLVMAIGTSIGGGSGRCCLSSALLTYGHTRIHYPHKNHCHHGGRGSQATVCSELECSERNGIDLDPHLSGLRTDWIYHC